MADELADIMIYCVYLAESIDADITSVMVAKVAANAEKYPIDKARGTSRTYTEL